jgi:hypothetical protein
MHARRTLGSRLECLDAAAASARLSRERSRPGTAQRAGRTTSASPCAADCRETTGASVSILDTEAFGMDDQRAQGHAIRWLSHLPRCDSDGARTPSDGEFARADVVPMHRMRQMRPSGASVGRPYRQRAACYLRRGGVLRFVENERRGGAVVGCRRRAEGGAGVCREAQPLMDRVDESRRPWCGRAHGPVVGSRIATVVRDECSADAR